MASKTDIESETLLNTEPKASTSRKYLVRGAAAASFLLGVLAATVRSSAPIGVKTQLSTSPDKAYIAKGCTDTRDNNGKTKTVETRTFTPTMGRATRARGGTVTRAEATYPTTPTTSYTTTGSATTRTTPISTRIAPSRLSTRTTTSGAASTRTTTEMAEGSARVASVVPF